MRQSVNRTRVALLAFAFPLLLIVGCGESSSTPTAATPSSTPSGPPSGYGGSSNDGYGGDGGGYGGGGGGYGGGNGYGDDASTASDAGDGDDVAADDDSQGTTTSDGYGGGYGDAYASNQGGYGGYGAPGSSGGGIDFAAQIEPLLRDNCYNCHGAREEPKGDLRLDSPDAITSSGVVAAGRADDSELLIRVSMERGADGAMPPKGPGLRPDEIELIRSWITSGANLEGGSGGYADGYGQPIGRGDGQPQAPPPPKTLAEFASREFSRGDDRRAMHYLFASALANSDDAAETLKKFHWVKALKRPALAVRWGIGVDYSEKSSITGGPRPIGVNQNLPGGDRDRSGGGGGSEGFDEEATYGDFKNAALDYYTGTLGDILAERLQMRIERGYYGDVLKEQILAALENPSDDDGFGDDGYGGGYDDGYGGGRSSRGGGYGGGYGYGGSAGGGGDDDEDKPEDKIEQVMPGVTMLGMASLPALFTRAQEQGIDVMVVFDVRVEKNVRARLYSNTTKTRLYDVASEKMLVATKGLNNVVMQKALVKDPDDDTINLELDKIFAVTDKDFVCTEMPEEIQAKHVVQRVKFLMGQKTDNPLRKLGEVCFYRSRDFLTDEQLAGVYRRMVPTQAEDLLKAEGDDQLRELVSPWIPSADEVALRDEDSEDEDDPSAEDEPRRRRDFR